MGSSRPQETVSTGSSREPFVTPSMVFPYGACRKGASIQPIPPALLASNLTRKAKRNLNPRKNKSQVVVQVIDNNQTNSSSHAVSSSTTKTRKQRPNMRVTESLEDLIPVPEDLMGKDNPFLEDKCRVKVTLIRGCIN